MKALVYIFDSDLLFAQEIAAYLAAQDIECRIFEQAVQLVNLVNYSPADVIVSEFQHDQLSGLELCKIIRQKTDAPILFTSIKNNEAERLIAYQCGADDFMLKPYSSRELAAKIKAATQRINQNKTFASITQSTFEAEEIELIPSKMQVSYLEQKIDLTQVEFKILELLMKKAGDIVSRQNIIATIYNDNRIVSDRTIDSHIKKLRLKINPILKGQEIIQSSYGQGYRYRYLSC